MVATLCRVLQRRRAAFEDWSRQIAREFYVSTVMVARQLWQHEAIGREQFFDFYDRRRELIFHVPSSSQAVANAVGRLGTWVQSENYRAHVLADFMDSADPFLVGAALETGSILVTHETPAERAARRSRSPTRAATSASNARTPSK